jgi:hypothetical protein
MDLKMQMFGQIPHMLLIEKNIDQIIIIQVVYSEIEVSPVGQILM